MARYVSVRKSRGIPCVFITESCHETVEENGNTVRKRKTRTVRSLGPLEKLLEKDPRAIEKLRKQCKTQRLRERRGEAEDPDQITDEDAPAEERKPVTLQLNYGIRLFAPVWDEWLCLPDFIAGLQQSAKNSPEFDLNRVLSFLTFSRLAGGASRDAFYAQLNFLGDPLDGIAPENLGGALGFIGAHKDALMHHLHARLTERFGRKLSKAFHDDATFRLQAPYTRRPQTEETALPAVSVTLFTDCDGIPADFWIYADEKELSAHGIGNLQTMHEAYGFGDTDFMGYDSVYDEIPKPHRAFVRTWELFKSLAQTIPTVPEFSRTKEQITGHITLCVLALTLLRVLQMQLHLQKIRVTFEDILKAVEEADVLAISADGKNGEFQKPPKFKMPLSKPRLTPSGPDDHRTPEQRLRDALTTYDYPIDRLLSAVGLKPLARFPDAAELAAGLKLKGGYENLAGKRNSRRQAGLAQLNPELRI